MKGGILVSPMHDIKQGPRKNHDPKTKTYDTVCSEIITVINERVAALDHVGEHSSLITDMDLDSVELVELIAKLEDKFGIEIPIDRLPELKTIKDLARLIFSLTHEHRMRKT